MLQWLGVRIAELSTLDQLADLVPAIVDHVDQVELTGLYLTDFRTGRLRLVVHRGLTPQEAQFAELTALGRHPGEVMRSGRAYRSDDVQDPDGDADRLWDFPRENTPRSRLYLPIWAGDRCVGCFGLASPHVAAFNDEHQAMLSFACGLFGEVWGRLEAQWRVDCLETRVAEADRSRVAARLAGGIAVDINNALTVLLAQLDDLDEVVVGDRPTAMIHAMRATCKRTGRLSRRLVPASRRPDRHRVVDLAAEVRRICEMLAPAVEPPLTLRVLTPDEPVVVCCDATDLDQILVNLITNARDAVVPGGTIECGVAVGDGRAVLTVCDDGIGMRPEVAEFACEPYFTTKQVGDGGGLGLTAVRDIATANGWAIDLDSGFGRGTRVSLAMPLSAALPAVTIERARPGEMLDITVLIAEDDAQIRSVVERRTRQFAARVFSVEDGVAALELIYEGLRPDVLVTDLVMPNGGAGALIDALMELRLGTQIIVMTAHGEADADAVIDRSDIAIEPISKPFGASELEARIRELVPDALPV